jgi:hypothetical protein
VIHESINLRPIYATYLEHKPAQQNSIKTKPLIGLVFFIFYVICAFYTFSPIRKYATVSVSHDASGFAYLLSYLDA